LNSASSFQDGHISLLKKQKTRSGIKIKPV
jgi:hypothetical protein